LFFREHHSSNLSLGWSGGGGATIVLEDLGADAPATVTRAEFGMYAGHGVRSPTSSKVQGGSKSRSWQGRSSASQPSRCRASPRRSWARGRCRGSGHRHFSNSNGLGEPILKLSKLSKLGSPSRWSFQKPEPRQSTSAQLAKETPGNLEGCEANERPLQDRDLDSPLELYCW